MSTDPLPNHDAVCNACGQAINPPRPPHNADHITMSIEQDCWWIERHRLRGGQGATMTNYICNDCHLLLDDWLRRSRQTPRPQAEGS